MSPRPEEDSLYRKIVPGWFANLKARYQAAGIILVLVVLWVGSSLLIAPAKHQG